MNEKVKMLYEKYGKLYLDTGEMSKEIGISYSKVNKIFSPKNGKGEKEILKYKILPVWRTVGETRLWSLESIVKWSEEFEAKTA